MPDHGDRPFFDPGTQTHYLAMPKGVFSAVDEGLAMLNAALFAETVSDGELVEVVCQDDSTLAPLLLRVNGIAAVCQKLPNSPEGGDS